MDLDDLDRALLLALLERPRAGLREHARALGIARGTAQARFLRLQERGVIVGFEPRVENRLACRDQRELRCPIELLRLRR